MPSRMQDSHNSDDIFLSPHAAPRALRSSDIRELRSVNSPAKKKKPNYASPDRLSSQRKQRLILALLRVSDGPLTVREIVDATGLSRQLAHYHLKKLAYRRELLWMFDRGKRRGETAVRIHWPTAELRRALGWQLEARQIGQAAVNDRAAA